VVAAWEAVADAAGVGHGTSLLDLGCGDGAFCSFAARRGAIVHGLDAAPDAIAEALEEVPTGDFRLAMMEGLPWANDSFDVVTAFNAVQYALDPELVLSEAARVVRPAGRIAVCKWGPPAGNEFFAFLASFGAGGVRAERLPVGDPVEDAIRVTRLEVLASDEVPAPIELGSEAALVDSLARAGILADPIAADPIVADTIAGDPIAAPVARAAAETAVRYRQPDGRYRFNNRLRFWVLRKPR
jgi:SAM-dependent methyltransferase